MANVATITPLNQFFDTNGSPLNSGYLFFGSPNQDPEQFPVQMFWDSAGTVPALQPIRTISGYPSRGGSPAIIYGPDSYSLRVKNSASVQVLYAPLLGGSATSASLAASDGSSLVGFIQAGTGAVLRTVQSKLRDFVNIKDYGVVGDGATNDTTNINIANAAAVSLGKALYWPAGTYLATNIPALAGMTWLGESSLTTIIKLKDGTNGGLVTSATTDITDVTIKSIRFDGNKANNTTGDVLTIKGSRPTLIDIIVINAAANGIVTDHNPASAGRLTGIEGFFQHITIDSPKRSGWLHNGPNDSNFDSIIIIDAGLETNNSYYGIFLTSNGRFNNLHTWNRDITTNVPLSSVYVNSQGNTFGNCHIEGGTTALTVASHLNTFDNCHYYAPRGTYAVQLLGNINRLTGMMGDLFASANPNYAGVLLDGSNNFIELSDGGCNLGAIDFTPSSGGNTVKIVGNRTTGVPYIGTPDATDDVFLLIQGAGGGSLVQPFVPAWVSFPTTLTSGSGTLTDANATIRYRKTGKTVAIQVLANIVTNGTGATSIDVVLPFTAAASSYVLSGRETGVSGTSINGFISSGGGSVIIRKYDNSYPGANGAIIVLTGVYESS